MLSDLYPRAVEGVIIDAGGYIGTAALTLSELFHKAHILFIEASSANFELLKRNVANSPNIQPIRAALVADGAPSTV